MHEDVMAKKVSEAICCCLPTCIIVICSLKPYKIKGKGTTNPIDSAVAAISYDNIENEKRSCYMTFLNTPYAQKFPYNTCAGTLTIT